MDMKLHLPAVTLFWADHKIDRLLKAFEICEYYADFWAKRIVTRPTSEYVTESWIRVSGTKLDSIEAYSYFMVKLLDSYIETPHVLVVQYDGFILNPDAWTDEFLEYDYVGAPWWYEDEWNVWNGGFSLRSKRLQQILTTDPNITETHPEDHHICRTYGKYLSEKYGIRFAPEELAKRFSIEWGLSCPPSGKYGDVWTNEFGFHGHGLVDTDISKWGDFDRFFERWTSIL